MQIKIGSTRICFMFSKVVVKIPIFLSWRRFIAGVASNYNEALIWEATTIDLINGQENQQYLCEVFENFGGLVLIAERVQRLTQEEFNSLNSYHRLKLSKLITEREFIYRNIGKVEVNGAIQYKILDYGINLNRVNERLIYRYFKILRAELGAE